MDNYNPVRVSANTLSSSRRARANILSNRCSDTVLSRGSLHACMVRICKREPMGRDISCVVANLGDCGKHDPFKRRAALHKVLV